MADVQHSQTVQEAPRGSAAGAIWLIQAFTGVLLVFLLLLHMIAHHFVVEGSLRNYDQVIDYISNPLIFATTIIFLIVVTIHAMLGLRAIILDLNISPAARKVVNWAVVVISIITIVYGIWLEVTLISA
jgi:succinate dehydrogenase hydrophobic anchor subunit